MAIGVLGNLDEIFLRETGLTILEYIKLSFVLFAIINTNPRFNIGVLTEGDAQGLNDVLNDKKMSSFLEFISSDYEGFRALDKERNSKLDPIYTKTRFNPLWLKPVVKMANNDYLAPSITAYATSTFKGLFWWFDDYFRKQSRQKGADFRSYFGSLFEEYVGDVIKDIYTERQVSPGIKFGTKSKGTEGTFFDWIATTPDKIFLFEAKASQFPLEVLQKGDPDKIRTEVVNKIIYAITQMYKRIRDVDSFEELTLL